MAAGRTFSSCLQARATHAILMSPSRNPQPNKASCTLPDFKGWTTDALIARLHEFGIKGMNNKRRTVLVKALKEAMVRAPAATGVPAGGQQAAAQPSQPPAGNGSKDAHSQKGALAVEEAPSQPRAANAPSQKEALAVREAVSDVARPAARAAPPSAPLLPAAAAGAAAALAQAPPPTGEGAPCLRDGTLGAGPREPWPVGALSPASPALGSQIEARH